MCNNKNYNTNYEKKYYNTKINKLHQNTAVKFKNTNNGSHKMRNTTTLPQNICPNTTKIKQHTKIINK